MQLIWWRSEGVGAGKVHVTINGSWNLRSNMNVSEKKTQFAK